MADNDHADGLDDFFAAAESDDSEALRKAADRVATPDGDEFPQAASKKWSGQRGAMDGSDSATPKFIAIEPHNIEGDGAPFIVVPQSIPALLPWWGWVSIVLVLVGIFLAVMLLPSLQLATLTSRLGENSAASQGAMRQLVLRGDERTVNKLYDLAASPREDIYARLRAIDTLSLMREPAADRALLRLELGSDTNAKVREHATAARKQREASAPQDQGDR